MLSTAWMRRLIALTKAVAIGALLVAALPADAFACGTAGCSLASRGDEGRLGTGALPADASFRSVDQDRRIVGSQLRTGERRNSLAPGVRFKLPARAAVYGSVQWPVFQHVNEGQLGTTAVVQVGISRSF